MRDPPFREADELAELVDRVNAVPASSKAFDVPFSEAGRFGLDPALLERLRELGLHARPDGSTVMLAGADLHYLGLRLGTFQEHLTAMSQWRATLELCGSCPDAIFSIEYLPLDAAGLVQDGRPAEVLLPAGRRLTSQLVAGEPVARFEHRVATASPVVPAAATALLERVGALDFYLLPPSLGQDTDRTRALRLADCAASAWLTVEELARVGLRGRMAHGLLLSIPFSRRHAWTELEVDGEWVAVDPLLLSALHQFTALDPQEWPVTRSPAAVLLKLSETDQCPVTVDGAELDLVFWTQRAR